jgi:hypothetical protein
MANLAALRTIRGIFERFEQTTVADRRRAMGLDPTPAELPAPAPALPAPPPKPLPVRSEAERAAIVGSPLARGREDLARRLAETSVTVDQALAVLTGLRTPAEGLSDAVDKLLARKGVERVNAHSPADGLPAAMTRVLARNGLAPRV